MFLYAPQQIKEFQSRLSTQFADIEVRRKYRDQLFTILTPGRMQRIESKAAAFLYHVNHINSYTGDLITNISSKLKKKMKTSFIFSQMKRSIMKEMIIIWFSQARWYSEKV